MANYYRKIRNFLGEKGKVVVHVSGSIALFSFLFYIYFLGHTIYTVVDRKAVEHSSGALAGEISSLELNYLKQVQSIDRSFALAHGFSEPVHTYYSNQNILLSLAANVR